MTVKEILTEIAGDPEKPNRFSKKSFNKLLSAMANDFEFEELVAQVEGGEYKGDKSYNPAKELRKWCRKVVEKAGIDKNESALIETADFTIDDVSGLHEYFASALYEFMASGNKYNIIPKKDLNAVMSIKPVGKKVKEVKARNPHTGEEMDPYEQETAEHRELKAQNKVPKYLKHRL